jgi:hypothetical protein
VHELPPEKLKNREVVHIDIANDPVTTADYKEGEDPTKFRSERTGRGPLVGQWIDRVLVVGCLSFKFNIAFTIFKKSFPNSSVICLVTMERAGIQLYCMF